ncbi:MAG: bioK [Planctomycetaceae bacterium]|nr:bioK [Planctomycetaceae bacterium]
MLPTTDQLREWDVSHVWHPFTPMQEYAQEETPIIVAGDGFEVIDSDGRRYLDGTSSLWCNVHGHRVPELDQALREQIDRIAHSTLLGLANGPSAELAKELVQRVPAGLNHVFYSDDGATAIEAALKMAFQFHCHRGADPTTKNLFVRLGEAYHGDTIGAVSLGGIPAFHRVFGSLLFRTLEVPAPSTYRTPAGMSSEEYLRHCDTELERILSENHERIAGFVIEPLVQGAAGMLVHPPGYLRRVRELTARFGIPLIADEVFVGFGRTGTLFACEQEGVVPDLMCLAKGLTGGYLPLAATLATDEIYAAFLGDRAARRTFFHGHTYTGNQLGCAVALASLRRFDSHRVMENVARNTLILRNWAEQFRKHPHVGDIRQCGIILALELVQDRSQQQRFPASQRIGHHISRAGLKRGIIIRPIDDVVIVMPAPGMPQDDLIRLLDATESAVQDVLQA